MLFVILLLMEPLNSPVSKNTYALARSFGLYLSFHSKVYVIVATPIVLITLHLLPWVHVSGDKRQPVGVFTLALVVVFVSCLLLSPFNRQNSPNRIVFHQEYDQIESTATVRLVTGQGLESTLEHYLTAEEAATLWCDDQSEGGYQITCTYQTKDVPVYAQQKDEYKLEIGDQATKVTATTTHRLLRFTTTVQHSHLCQLKMNVPMLSASVNGEPIHPEGGEMNAVMSYVNQAGEPVRWEIEIGPDDSLENNLTVQVSCLYDDWTQGELPAYTNLRNRLPETQALTIKGGIGLAMVHYPVVNLQ